ncbi:hypothetical protein NDU88_003540 [Pleurodeles waltl]|uniref:Uncharacterized protein n=1 Tax=Pleurodeles waltl TaxID=8319 RepID=A0AAV7NK60_PLEWA|nr:hypothetical protein NDU88_003540 [Pleurodeles waltl]
MVDGKVAELATEESELQQQVAETEEDRAGMVNTIKCQEGRLEMVQAKEEDLENQQRNNNLRVFGVPGRREGEDPRAFIVKFLEQAFMDLADWNIDSQIQHAHHLPTNWGHDNRNFKYPRPFLIYVGSFLLRQAISPKARPTVLLIVDSMSIFVRSDFSKLTTECCWKLQQMSDPLKAIRVQVFLQGQTS